MFGKNLTSKSSKSKVFCGFRVLEYVLWNKRKPGNAGNQQKAF